MLHLSRHIGEQIFIDGGRIRIKLLGFRGTEVVFGIETSKETVIDREEIHNAKKAQTSNEE